MVNFTAMKISRWNLSLMLESHACRYVKYCAKPTISSEREFHLFGFSIGFTHFSARVKWFPESTSMDLRDVSLLAGCGTCEAPGNSKKPVGSGEPVTPIGTFPVLVTPGLPWTLCGRGGIPGGGIGNPVGPHALAGTEPCCTCWTCWNCWATVCWKPCWTCIKVCIMLVSWSTLATKPSTTGGTLWAAAPNVTEALRAKGLPPSGDLDRGRPGKREAIWSQVLRYHVKL